MLAEYHAPENVVNYSTLDIERYNQVLVYRLVYGLVIDTVWWWRDEFAKLR